MTIKSYLLIEDDEQYCKGCNCICDDLQQDYCDHCYDLITDISEPD